MCAIAEAMRDDLGLIHWHGAVVKLGVAWRSIQLSHHHLLRYHLWLAGRWRGISWPS